MRPSLKALTLLFFIPSAYVYATTIDACVTRLGRMTLIGPTFSRQACKHNETAMSFNSEGPQGIQGPIGPQGPVGPQGVAGMQLHLFDGNGQDLGILVNSNIEQTPQLFLTYLKDQQVLTSFESRINPNQIALTAGQWGGVFFENTNCTGAAFSRNNFITSTSGSLLIDGNPAGYFKYAGGQAMSHSSLSYAQGSNCINTTPENSLGYTLEQVLLPFTQPLIWPLSINIVP